MADPTPTRAELRRLAENAIEMRKRTHGQWVVAMDALLAALTPAVVLALLDAADRAEKDSALLEKSRVALRSIGPVYHHVRLASERAHKGGNDEASEALDHVYGRLYWMDYALGTMTEGTATMRSRRALPSPEAPSGDATQQQTNQG